MRMCIVFIFDEFWKYVRQDTSGFGQVWQEKIVVLSDGDVVNKFYKFREKSIYLCNV